MFGALLAIEIVGCLAILATVAFFQDGQMWAHRRGLGAMCKAVGVGAAVLVIVAFGFGFTNSLSILQFAFLFAPMMLLVLMFAALVDDPYPDG